MGTNSQFWGCCCFYMTLYEIEIESVEIPQEDQKLVFAHNVAISNALQVIIEVH